MVKRESLKNSCGLLVILSLISFITWIVFCIVGEKYLYMDGAKYFFSVAAGGGYSIYPAGRKVCDILMQMFMVWGYRSGITSLQTMGVLYGLGVSIWPALFGGISIAVCMKYKREDYAEIFFLFLMTVLFFTGFYCQVESIIGFSAFALQLSLYLFHEDEKKISSVAETIGMLALLPLTIHLNEYFTFWALLLAAVVGYRVWRGRKRLHPLWALAAIAEIGIAIRSAMDISARGEATSIIIPSLKMIACMDYVLWILMLLAILALSYNVIKIRNSDKWITILHKCFFLLAVVCTVLFTALLSKQSAYIRYGNLELGLVLGG